MELGVHILVLVFINPGMVDGVTLVIDDDGYTGNGQDRAGYLDDPGRLEIQPHDTCRGRGSKYRNIGS